MTNARKNNTRIKENVLWEDYYSSMHRAYDAMLDIFQKRVENEGLSSGDIAQRLGVDKALISRRLNGRENLTLKTLSNMALAMNSKLMVDFKPYEELSKSNYPNSSFIDLSQNPSPTHIASQKFSFRQFS